MVELQFNVQSVEFVPRAERSFNESHDTSKQTRVEWQYTVGEIMTERHHSFQFTLGVASVSGTGRTGASSCYTSYGISWRHKKGPQRQVRSGYESPQLGSTAHKGESFFVSLGWMATTKQQQWQSSMTLFKLQVHQANRGFDVKSALPRHVQCLFSIVFSFVEKVKLF